MMIVEDTGMDYDSFSCIKEITKNVSITLSTAYQANEITGISNVLDSWKRQYIQQLQGVVVSYKNVSLTSKYAYIKSDYPTIHCNVKATFELFSPTVGSIVNGKVNRISHDYIGCLVHNSINAAIDLSRNECDSISHFITLDQVILFEIIHIGFKRKIIRVKGKITQECVNLMKDMQLLNLETGTNRENHMTSLFHTSGEDTAGEDLENNFDEDIEFGNQSQSLLNNSVDLLDGNLNNVNASSQKKKKKSNEFQTECSVNGPFGISDMKSEDMSPSLLSNDSRLFDKDSSDISHDSSKKKKKKSDKSQNKLGTKRPFDCVEAKSEDESISSLSYESAELSSKISVGADSHSSKKKKKKSNKKSKIELKPDKLATYSPFEITLTSSCHSPPQKSFKQSNNSSPDKHLTTFVADDNSPDTSSHLSLSSKMKKHKKSKVDGLSSPSLFSDSVSSSVDETELFKVPKSPSKKKKKSSQDQFSSAKMNLVVNDFISQISSIPSSTSASSPKAKIKSEDFDYMMEVLSSFDPSLESKSYNEVLPNDVNDKSLNRTKKGKKRKHESPDKDSLPKKKKKVEKENIRSKHSSKQKPVKAKKKSKEKSEKDSKKDKKRKSKKRVISSKKKLPKLKKKKKEKGEKLKKKVKKASKHKNEVP